MGNFIQISEARTWFSHTLTDLTAVTGGGDIVEITTIIENSPASLINIDAVFSTAGKLYYVDGNDEENYLTDSNSNYPAKMTILATFFLKKGESVKLRFSENANMHHLYVSHTAGVF